VNLHLHVFDLTITLIEVEFYQSEVILKKIKSLFFYKTEKLIDSLLELLSFFLGPT